MEPTARTWIAALRGSQQRLAALVGTLTPEQLRGACYATGWTIAQVLSHIGSQAEIAEQALAAALAGREPFGLDGFKSIWAVWNARDPDQQAVECLVHDRRHVRRLEQLTDEQLAGVRLKFGGTELDAVGTVWLRLGEHALHSWDVAVSLDPAAVVAPQSVALLVDRIPQVAARTGKPRGEPFTVGIGTTGPEREFLLDIGDTVSMSAGPAGPVDGAARPVDGAAGPGGDASAAIPRLRMPAEALLRLVYGRLDPDHTPPVETLSGAIDLDMLRKTFPGF
jgi:uncharacterized protein (TIGR03083 family)